MNEPAEDEYRLTNVPYLRYGAVALAVVAAAVVAFAVPMPGNWRSVVISLAGSLAAGGIVGVGIDIMVRREFLYNTQAIMTVTLRSEMAMLQQLWHAGIRGAFRSAGEVNLEQRFRNARRRIQVVQTWIPDLPHKVQGLKEALGKGVTVRILVLDPRCSAADTRSAEIGLRGVDVANINLATFDVLSKVRSSGTFEVKTYEGTPSFGAYCVDDTWWMMIFWRGESSDNQTVLEVSNGSLVEDLERHFNAVWEGEGKAIPLGVMEAKDWGTLPLQSSPDAPSP